MNVPPLTIRTARTGTIGFIVGWQALVWGSWFAGADDLSKNASAYGQWMLFFIGLGWLTWIVERAAKRFEAQRRSADLELLAAPSLTARYQPPPVRGWNPLDPDAWYYGSHSQRLKQTVAVFTTYSLVFLGGVALVTLAQGCGTMTYELPAGGGSDQVAQQEVKIQKVIRKKFVINPYSSILFTPPPIDKVDLKIMEVTKHFSGPTGLGSGEGSGFAGGTGKGKVRFIRLQYDGGDWDQDFGIGADLNMLIEYGVRTGQKVAEKTESVTVAQLATFPAQKSPPVIYLTGQGNIIMSKADRKILKDYMIEKHGMVFGDNGGSRHFHNQFVALMNDVTGVQPVPVPLDDVIHRRPYPLPFLPYVAPHGGREALGWKIDGRWVCYYHPGDIGDAWSDGHSGVKPEIYEACYQLGVNIIFYAHAEYSKWLTAQRQP